MIHTGIGWYGSSSQNFSVSIRPMFQSTLAKSTYLINSSLLNENAISTHHVQHTYRSARYVMNAYKNIYKVPVSAVQCTCMQYTWWLDKYKRCTNCTSICITCIHAACVLILSANTLCIVLIKRFFPSRSPYFHKTRCLLVFHYFSHRKEQC